MGRHSGGGEAEGCSCADTLLATEAANTTDEMMSAREAGEEDTMDGWVGMGGWMDGWVDG